MSLQITPVGTKSILASKTAWLGFGTTALGILGILGQVPWLTFGPWGGVAVAGIGLATVILRTVTSQPVSLTGS